MKYKVEYVWLDGYEESNLRSKTKIIENKRTDLQDNLLPGLHLSDLPQWSFDGSSTRQAKGDKSDCLLKPVRMIDDPERKNAYIVMCEVLNPDGTPHITNTRALIDDEADSNELKSIKDTEDYWFGMEQEYTLMKDGRPAGFPKNGYPAGQGMYYCSVGKGNVTGRDIVEQHLDLCLEAGLNITGINAEVLLGQWEYQILGKGIKQSGDDLWLSRYLLYRITEKNNMKVSLHPKPLTSGDWNGSGCHFNFSNRDMREVGGEELMTRICKSFEKRHNEHIKHYGLDNEKRLTGDHETQSIEQFSYGISDRGASIRIPVAVPSNDWKGYLEDRRPASNCDPYEVVKMIVEAVSETKLIETI